MNYKEVREVKERHETDLLSIPGVEGVGITGDDDSPAITVYVDSNVLRWKSRLPNELEDVPVKVEESGGFSILSGGA